MLYFSDYFNGNDYDNYDVDDTLIKLVDKHRIELI